MKKTLRAQGARSQPEELLAAMEGVSSGMAARDFIGSSGFSSAPAKKGTQAALLSQGASLRELQ